MTIGERINAVIRAEGIKKVAFANKLNIDQSYVSRIIYGKGVPSARLLDDISEKFGISRVWLETGEGDMYEESASQTLDAITVRYNGDAVERYIALLADALSADQSPENVIPAGSTAEEIVTALCGSESDAPATAAK